MRVRTIAIISVVSVAAVVGLLFLFSYVSDRQEKKSRVAGLVEEGFLVLNGNPDEAIRLAMEARSLDENNSYALILQGRALNFKNRHHDVVKTLQLAMNNLQDLDLMPELNYHIGFAYLNLCKETGVRDDWREAFKNLSDAAREGGHMADANIALGLLHAIKEYLDQDKIVQYWETAFELQKGVDGYPGSGKSGACPHCRREFQKWRDQQTVVKHYELIKSMQ
jgi:tetratricopeptide (TPR) repeat protein